MTLRRWSAGLWIALVLGSMASATSLPAATTAAVAATTAAPTVIDPLEARVGSDLRQVTSLELPATAAQLVRAVYGDERERTALAIVHVVARLNPPALPSVVGAMSRIQPSLGPKLAAEAAKLQPRLAPRVELAATAASPVELGPPIPTKRHPATMYTSTQAPESVGDPIPTSRHATTIAPDPQPTPADGKKKGHYKRPQGP